MENNVKEKLLSQTTFNFIWFNCCEHKDFVYDHITNTCSIFIIRNFCMKINKILCGKTLHPINPNIIE